MKPWKKKDSPADHTAGKKGCGELEGNFVHAHWTEIPLETPDQYGNQTGSYGIRDASLVKKGEAEGCRILPARFRSGSGLSALIWSSFRSSSLAEKGCLQKWRLKSLSCSNRVKSFPPFSRIRRVWVLAPSPGNSMVTTMLEVITKTFIWVAPQA